jgi:hypothetical protein
LSLWSIVGCVTWTAVGARPLLKKGLGGMCDVRASGCALGEEQD